MATYKTEIHDGVIYRMKHWVEKFIDEDTGDVIKVNRKKPVKRDGKRCNVFGTLAKVIKR